MTYRWRRWRWRRGTPASSSPRTNCCASGALPAQSMPDMRGSHRQVPRRLSQPADRRMLAVDRNTTGASGVVCRGRAWRRAVALPATFDALSANPTGRSAHRSAIRPSFITVGYSVVRTTRRRTGRRSTFEPASNRNGNALRHPRMRCVSGIGGDGDEAPAAGRGRPHGPGGQRGQRPAPAPRRTGCRGEGTVQVQARPTARRR